MQNACEPDNGRYNQLCTQAKAQNHQGSIIYSKHMISWETVTWQRIVHSRRSD